MQKFGTLDDAIALAEYAHRNQRDKAGLPYIEHPRRVLAKVQAQGALPFVQMAAILHDVLEDTAFTDKMLVELGFSVATVQIINLVSRNYDNGMDYYRRIGCNEYARMVKLADIEDNLSEWRLAYLPYDEQVRLRNKYQDAKTKIGMANV